MTYSPATSSQDEEQLNRYYETIDDGSYKGPNVEEGRPGPDGKVASTEAPPKPEAEAEQPTTKPEQPEKSVQEIFRGKNVEGMSTQDMEEEGGFIDNLIPRAIVDFGMDAIGKIPGAASIDDAWDEMTKFKNPNVQQARDIASVIVPSIAASLVAGPAASRAVTAINGGKMAAGIASVGASAVADTSIAFLSDYSERDEGLARSTDEFLESIGRPMGLKVPQAIQVMDDDSPEVRRNKLMLEAGGLSVIGDAIGYLFKAGKPIMNWFEPKDDAAKAFKEIKIRENPDPDTVFRSMELDEEINQIADELLITTDPSDISLLQTKQDALIEENAALFQSYFNTGRTSATVDPLASAIEEGQASRGWQTDEIGAKKLQQDPQRVTFDADVQSPLAPESARPTQAIPRANVARNAADIAATRSGTSTGIPAPLISKPMLKDGMELDEPSRTIISRLVEDLNEGGDFAANVDGFRFLRKQIDDSALDLFTEIVSAKDVDELRSALLPKKYVRMVDESFGVNMLVDSTMPDVGKAIKYLSKEFLGEDVTAMSARVMETTAKEVEAHLDAMRIFKGQANEDAVQDIIIDKLALLTEEYGIAKYASSWSLKNLGWWKSKSPEAIAEHFTDVANLKHKEAQQFGVDMRQFKKDNPEMAANLYMAYDMSNGDVNTIAKLNAWAKTQINPMTAVVGSKFGSTSFNENLQGVIYNNVLSGLSAGRAMIGGISSLALKPIDYMVGAGVRGVMKGNFNDVRKGMYAFGVEFDVMGRALNDGWQTFKKASNDPESMMQMLRKDYSFQASKNTDEILDRMALEYERNGDVGNLMLSRWNKANRYLSMNKFMRYGTNAMLGIDRATNIMMATMVSKFNAWDEAYTVGQKMDPEKLLAAQEKHYAKVFDPKTDLIKDSWTKQQAADIALNETTGVGDFLSKATTKLPALKAFMMFPNTGINQARKALSYTPFGAIPNSSRNAKALMATSPEQIDEVMVLHGISPDDPDKLRILDNLKTEYTGRLVVGSMTALGAAQYALSGNIRGNYPKDKARKNYLISNGWKPKTIKLGGVWVSYAGIQMLDPILAMVGDMAEYSSDMSSPFKEDIIEKLGWTLSQSFGSASPLTGLEPLIALTQGDDGAMQRLLNNYSRMAIPLSSAQAVLAKGVDSSLKETYDDLQNYISSRIPIVNTTVPKKFDWWTGQPIQEIDNPMLRMLNAINPIPMSQAEEPWRIWVNQSGIDLSQMMLTDSTGTHKYSSAERSELSKLIGEQQIYKKVETMMKNPKYNDQLDIVRAEMSTGKTFDELQPETRDLPVVERLIGIVQLAKDVAEQQLLQRYPSIQHKINGKDMVDKKMQAGDPSGAFKQAEKTQQQLKQLEQFR